MNNFEKLLNMVSNKTLNSENPIEKESYENEVIEFINKMTVKELLHDIENMDNEDIKIKSYMQNLLTTRQPRIFNAFTEKLENHSDFVLNNFLFITHMEKKYLDYFIGKIPDFFHKSFKKHIYKTDKNVFEAIMDMHTTYEPEFAFSLYNENIKKFSEEQKLYFKKLVDEKIIGLTNKGILKIVFDYPEWHSVCEPKKNKDIITIYLEKYGEDKEEYLELLLNKIEENKEIKKILKIRNPTLFNELNLYTHNINLLQRAYDFSDKDKIKAWSHNPKSIGRKEWLSREVKSILNNMIEKFGDEILINPDTQHQQLFAKYLSLSKPTIPQIAFITNLIEIKNNDLSFLSSEDLKNQFMLISLIYANKKIELSDFEIFMKTNDRGKFNNSHYHKELKNHSHYDAFMSIWDKVTLEKTLLNPALKQSTHNRL